MSNGTNAQMCQMAPLNQKTGSATADLYFGIFFDGTNNNNVQALVGQYFRRESVYERHKYQLLTLDGKEGRPGPVKTLEQLTRCTRPQLEATKLFSTAELDMLFGASKTIDHDLEAKITSRDTEYRSSTVINSNFKGEKDWKETRINQMAKSQQQQSMWQLGQDKMLGTLSFATGSNYTNPAILESIYKTGSWPAVENNVKEFHYSFYIEGSGADTNLSVTDRVSVNGIKESVGGLGFGIGDLGVAAKCKTMATKVSQIVQKFNIDSKYGRIRLFFDIYGFSRGATTARLFTYVINPRGGYQVPAQDYKLFTGSESTYLPLKGPNSKSKIEKKTVRLLGLYDTVSSIGILRDPLNDKAADLLKVKEKAEYANARKSLYFDCNVDDFGLYATDKANSVLHLCALDENRKNFALVDIESSIRSNGTEIFLPGCHTDIGGGGSYGLDDVKVIDCETTMNKGEIILDAAEKLKGTAKAASDIMDTIKAAKDLIAGVKEIATGIAAISTGVGSAVGVVAAVHGAVETYRGAKDMVYASNRAAHSIKDTFVEVEDETQAEIEKKEWEALVKEKEKNSIIGRAMDGLDKVSDHTDTMKDISGISAVQNASTLVGSVPSDLETIFGDESLIEKSKAVADLKDGYDSTMDSLDKFQSVSSQVDSLTAESKALVADIKASLNGIKDHVNHEDWCLLQEISDTIWDLLNDMKQTLAVAKDTCSTVKDIVTKKKKPLLLPAEKKATKFYNDLPFANHVGTREMRLSVSLDSLKKLGWVPANIEYSDEKTWLTGSATDEALARGKTIVIKGTKAAGVKTFNNVALYKYAAPGYSNVSLKLMWQWSRNKIAGVFDQYPEGMFPVPTDLVGFYNGVSGRLGSVGRFFCAPTYETDYRKLRCKYLHLSMSQSLTGDLVNGPALVTYGYDAVITRQIYVGAKGSPTAGTRDKRPAKEKYLYQYAGAQTKVNCNLNVNVTPLAPVSTAPKTYQELPQQFRVSPTTPTFTANKKTL